MLEENILNITKRIKNKCDQIGRNYSEITLVAVSKTKPVELIYEAEKLGLINFGENKSKELKQKAAVCSEKIKWHFIGHLQTNKVKDVVPVSYLIHSVDTLKLAGEINKRAKMINKKQNVLLEVKTSGEESKYGVTNEKEFNELVDFCKKSENLNLLGLMTMAPFTDNEKLIRDSFKKLRYLLNDLNNDGYNLKHLSMGMTNDFEIALEEGATILRIGTAIFGKRNYNN